MTSKPAEEGWYWEWRAFGDVPESVVERITIHAVRGAPDVVNDDLYVVSSLSDQNVKVRGDGELLKLKPRYLRLDDGSELYEESSRLIFSIPAPPEAIVKAASLLGVPAAPERALDGDALVALFASFAPEVRVVRARKRRTQYAVGGAWIELAEVRFPRATVRSVGVQSSRLDVTRRVRDAVDPDRLLRPMNYVDACRRWS